MDVKRNGSKVVHLAEEERRRWQIAQGATVFAVVANAAIALWLPYPMNAVNVFLSGMAFGFAVNVYWGRP